MRKLKLETTGDLLTEISRAADGRGEFGQVRKSALNALLRDHQRLLAWHRGEYAEADAVEIAPPAAVSGPKPKPAPREEEARLL